MNIGKLTLDQIYDLEAAHSASVGSRTAVFLASGRRLPTAKTPAAKTSGRALAGKNRSSREKEHARPKTHAKI